MENLTDEQAKVLTGYADGPARLEATVAGLAEADLDQAVDSGSWNIRQIVHHIADGDDLWKAFIKQALGNGEACFDAGWYWSIPQTQWAESWAYRRRDIRPSLALLKANRLHITQLIQEIPGAWERSIPICWLHKKSSANIGDVVEMQRKHLIGHIEDIQHIRQALGF